MDALNKAFRLIEQNKDIRNFNGYKNESLIHKAEIVLGVQFPKTYRFFLAKYGCGNIKSFEIYGILDEKFDYQGAADSIGLTLNERKTGCPHSFIIIGSTGFGPLYVLDSSQPDQNGEYPVLLWMPGNPFTPTEKVNNNFGDFLLEQVQDVLSWEDES